jgi:acyl carrier protein
MPTDTIRRQLARILADQLGYSLDPEKIRDDISLYGKGLGLNSLDAVSLVVRLEEAFDITFEAEDIAASVKTFGALVRTVEQKRRHAEGPGSTNTE